MATGRIGTTPVLTTRWSKAPSAGTTSLSGLDDNSVSLVYSVGYEAVYQNGVLLSRGNDYTATNGTTITLTTATVAGDIIEVFANQTIPLTDTYSQTVSDGRFIKNTLTTTTGDIIYASAANTPARLGIGSSSQVLTVSGGVPTWATPASGGMTLISTTTMTGSGVTLSSIPSTYNHLQLVVRSFKPATDGGLYIRFNNDGNTRYYSNVSNDLYSSGTSYNASSFTVSNTQDSGGDNGLIIVDIFDYTNTTTWKFVNSSALTQNGTTNTDLNYRFGFGAWNQTSAISQLDFYPASGNFTSGTILLYGVK